MEILEDEVKDQEEAEANAMEKNLVENIDKSAISPLFFIYLEDNEYPSYFGVLSSDNHGLLPCFEAFIFGQLFNLLFCLCYNSLLISAN